MHKVEIAPATPAPTQWGFIVLIGALTAITPVAVDMYLPALPAMGAEFNVSPARTQATVASFLAGLAVGQLIYGAASDRLGRRGPILFGMVLFVAATVACALAQNVEQLILARFVQALGGSAGQVVGRAMVRDSFDHRETARALSLMMLIIGLGPVLAPMAGSALLLAGGWRVMFWTIAVLGAAMGLIAFWRLKETRSAETAAQAANEHPLRTYWMLLREPRLTAYGFASGMNGLMVFAYISSSPELVITTYGVPATLFGFVFGVNALGMVTAAQVNRAFLRRGSPEQVLAVASPVAVAVALLLTLVAVTGLGGMYGFLALLFCVIASYGLIQGNVIASALNFDPRRAGAISSLMGGISFTCGAAGAVVSGQLHDGTARPLAYVILVSLAVSALLLHLVALPKELRFRPTRA